MGTRSGQVNVVSRVSALLRLLAANNRVGMRLVDIIKACQIGRSTTHRLLQSMISEGLVYQDHETKRYYLGMAVYEMGVAVPALKLRDICQPFVMAIAQQTGDTAFLTVRSGFNGICIDRKEGGSPIAYVQEAGRSRPLVIGAGGLSILCALPEQEVQRIRQENMPRIGAWCSGYTEQEIDARLSAGRSCGYVFANVLEKPGIRALGMAVKDASGRPIAALSMSALLNKWSTSRFDCVLGLLRETIRGLESALLNEPGLKGRG